jgi:hypothetical protein
MDDKMNKRPSLQFYPADWLKDPDLQMCSMNTVGVWINLLCRMWESKEEGVLKGKVEELALLVGANPVEFERFLNDVKSHNFADVTNCNGDVTIICRRMNRLYKEREGTKARVRKHRNKDVTLYSSSSTSSSNKYTLKECIDCAVISGLTEEQGEEFFNHYNGQGWLFGNQVPVTNLRSALARWKRNQHKHKKKESIDQQLKRVAAEGKKDG